MSDDIRAFSVRIIGRVVHAVIHLDDCKIEWRYALQTSRIRAELAWIGTALVEGVNPAFRAEIVLSRAGIELIQRQRIFTFEDFHAIEIGGNSDGPAHPAIGAGAAPRRVKAIGKFDAKAHRSAVAGAVGDLNIGVHADLLFREN